MGNHLKRIALFGGTFDPFHLGHLNLAIEMLEKRQLDQICFCPAKQNPFKQDETFASAFHRLEMIKQAIKPIPSFTVSDVELKREGPSYTLETILELKKEEREAQFFLILGEDAVRNFAQWHRADEIVQQACLLIGGRQVVAEIPFVNGSEAISKAIKEGMTPTREMDISATEVRQRLKKELFCGHLVPKEILDYIQRYQLYL